MKADIVRKSRDLMRQRTLKNKAPAWGLTEIAITKGKILARKYKVDEKLVLTSLYLAHTVFSQKIGDKIRHHHEELSAQYAEVYLKRWGVSEKEREIIRNAIRAHHAKVKTKSKVAEVMKNAECFKFLTLKGALIYLHDLGTRGMSLEEALEQVKYKARQKLGYVTLKAVRAEAQRNYKLILKTLDFND